MPPERSVSRPMTGWGRFTTEETALYRPESRAGLTRVLSQVETGSYIPRGLGRSYGDTALNRTGGVILQERMDRFLSFDPDSGLLECEGGVGFQDIIETFLPRGYFLPVTPGTKFVTVGGAIANDVHGKNHHRDGSIGNFIEALTLLLPGGEVLACSPTIQPDVFWATVGGIGLTGVILSAKLRLKRVESAYATVDYRKARNLDEAMDWLDESDHRYEYSVSWIDCLATGKSLGRSVLMQGNRAPKDRISGDPFALPRKQKMAIPFDFPSGVLNTFSVGAFNQLFYHKHRNVTDQLVDFENYFYPLDAIHQWNRMYGPKGFLQYQIALPLEAGREGLTLLLERISRSGRASFLAVLKRFGAGNPGLLSFPMKGYTLALDIPNSSGLVPFLQELDQVVMAFGGRGYLAKDAAVMTAETFARMYPNLDRFREIQHRLDPHGVLSSSMARRLKIVGD